VAKEFNEPPPHADPREEGIRIAAETQAEAIDSALRSGRIEAEYWGPEDGKPPEDVGFFGRLRERFNTWRRHDYGDC
jgi:hypothetical protein